ncbi:MAG: protoporphyrinogen oxidase HemJ [Proteobacteria bacterium]|nr:protoporphyrinogen oxidase HemJ [Pseudomonadota bacterium]
MQEYYLHLKALHIIFVIAWMAGLLYMPRLFVYHTQATLGGELDVTLQTMERRLYRGIMLPSLIGTLLFGFLLISAIGLANFGKWLHVKLAVVLVLFAMHGMMGCYRKRFLKGTNKRSALYYRIFNEIPAVLMVVIVFLVVLQPF